jgi:hypothetical protein
MRFFLPWIIHIFAIALSIALVISVYLKALGGSFSTGPIRYGEFSQNICFLVIVSVFGFAGFAYFVRSQALVFGRMSLLVIGAGFVVIAEKATKNSSC